MSRIVTVELDPAARAEKWEQAVQEDDRELAPSEHLVDMGYIRASNVLSTRERHALDLVSPLDQGHQWQTRVEDGFMTDHFRIDCDQRRAVCLSQGWCETHPVRDRDILKIR